MSDADAPACDAAGRAALAACWGQWQAITGCDQVLGEQPGRAIIDPEALVLASLLLRSRERRLQDRLLWWSRVGMRWMSVQRIQTLLEFFPGSVRVELNWFAARCLDSGDRRWKKLGQSSDLPAAAIEARDGKGPDELLFAHPSTLLIRLRAGFGVGAKADLLAFLLGIAAASGEREGWASAEVISRATSYSGAAIRRALSDMVVARLVRESRDRPAQYSVDSGEWSPLLRGVDEAGPSIPSWRFCSQMLSFLIRCVQWEEETRTLPAVVRASRARDVFETSRQPLRWNGIRVPDPELYLGERFLVAFEGLVRDTAEWAREQL